MKNVGTCSTSRRNYIFQIVKQTMCHNLYYQQTFKHWVELRRIPFNSLVSFDVLIFFIFSSLFRVFLFHFHPLGVRVAYLASLSIQKLPRLPPLLSLCLTQYSIHCYLLAMAYVQQEPDMNTRRSDFCTWKLWNLKGHFDWANDRSMEWIICTNARCTLISLSRKWQRCDKVSAILLIMACTIANCTHSRPTETKGYGRSSTMDESERLSPLSAQPLREILCVHLVVWNCKCRQCLHDTFNSSSSLCRRKWNCIR